jgi:hypothetical protein
MRVAFIAAYILASSGYHCERVPRTFIDDHQYHPQIGSFAAPLNISNQVRSDFGLPDALTPAAARAMKASMPHT